MGEKILILTILISSFLNPISSLGDDFVSPRIESVEPKILAEHDLDLTNRLPGEYGNQVFTDNILLSLHYLKGDVERPLDWDKIREPFEVSFTLQPGEVFAFHGNSLVGLHPVITMNSRFFMEEGYRSLAGLGGNGVCHLASLINWTAYEAGLEVFAPVGHDFFPISGIPKEFGVSIKSQDPRQNLYIRNNKDISLVFEFRINDQSINLKIIEGLEN